MGPTEAILQIFDKDPSKAWTPVALRDELIRLKEKGILTSNSGDLLSAVHSVLRIYVKNGEVVKDTSQKITKYRKKKQEIIG